jgi:hypothetical protein
MSAAAMRLPIVASGIQDWRKVVTQGATGPLCPQNAAAATEARRRSDRHKPTERIWETHQELTGTSARPAVL